MTALLRTFFWRIALGTMFLVVLAALAVHPALLHSAAAADGLFFHTAVVEDVGPGIQHITLQGSNDKDRQAIHIVRIARDAADVALTASLARDRVEGTESVLNQARRVHGPDRAVVAAVNADFFASSPIPGQPVGIHLEQGELVVSPNGRPVFGIDADGAPLIHEASFWGEVWREGDFDDDLFARAAIAEVNRPLTRLELVLYTPRLGADTPPVNGTVITVRGVEGPLQPGVVYTGEVVESDVLSTPGGVRVRIPDDGIVLAARGPAQVMLDDVAVGERLHFEIGLDEPLHRLTTAVAGWPVLLEDGKPAELPASDPLVSGRHPRTAIGFNEHEIFLVTVDGRQPGYADGMNLYELTDLMIALGATHALNLDGGGSTTMLVRPPGRFDPVIVNRPSDGHERTVANALLVVSTAAEGSLARLLPTPASAAETSGTVASVGTASAAAGRTAAGGFGTTAAGGIAADAAVQVLVGGRMPLTALGQDGRHGPVAVDVGEISWSVQGDAGFMSSANGPQFVATQAGRAVITTRTDGASGDLAIDVVDGIARLELVPDIVNLSTGDTAAVGVRGYDERGRPVWVSPEQLQWTVEASSVVDAGSFVDAGAVADAGSVVDAGAVADAGASETPASKTAEGAFEPVFEGARDAEANAATRADDARAAAVDGSGRITGLRSGEAVITARYGDVEAQAVVIVDRAPLTVAAFEQFDAWFANAVRARATLTFEPAPESIPLPNEAPGSDRFDPTSVRTVGNTNRPAAKLTYDFTVADGATAAAYVQATTPVPLTDRPTALGAWVYAEQNEHWLRAHLIDGEGTRHVVDFTAVGGIDWQGWRYVTAPLPVDLPLPLAFERIYVTAIHRHRQTPGVLYFGPIQALYHGVDGTEP